MALALDVNPELLKDFIDESMESLNTVDSLFVRLETSPGELALVESIFRPIHSMKGNAAYFGLMRVKDLAHRMESLLDLVRKGRRRIDRRLCNLLLRGLDALRMMLSRVRDQHREVENEDDFLPLLIDLEAEGERGDADSVADLLSDVPESTIPAEAEPSPRAEKAEAAGRTMRISEENIDRFLEQVGELMGLEELFRYLGKRMVDSGLSDEFANDLRQATEQFGHLSAKLSREVMELRRTEARPLLQKVPRLVRDVAEVVGKRIEIRTEGEDIRIDKSYLELLDAPLMHMVRNACDHGIDLPKERLQAGKPEVGRITVAITEQEEALVMSVSDDGRGLNMDGLRRKALELGLVRPEAPFLESDAVALLFHSGVSTAREVTEISGRGVGMDVVKREIEGVGGRIEVSTVPGQGSVFRVVLPRSITTRISDGFLFRCGQERFVLPMRSVLETFTAADARMHEVAGGGTMVHFRREIFRLVGCDALLEAPPMRPEEGVLVRIRVRNQSCVLQVHEALGVQRTVVKPVEEFCRGEGIFAGAAMLGDGGLALVLSEDGLASWLAGATMAAP